MTIKEIAKLAGVSRGTVDRVINNRDNVSKETKEKILKIIKKYDFRPNEYARSLSMHDKKFKIGVIAGSIDIPFFQLVVKGIKKRAHKYKNAGISIILKKVILHEKEMILNALDELKNENISALIITSFNDPQICLKIDELNTPCVCINNRLNVKNCICYIGCDYFNSGSLIANLINLIGKSKNIGVVESYPHNFSTPERLTGFEKTLNGQAKIIDKKYNYDDENISYQCVKEMIKNNNNLDTICFFGSGIKGGLKAIYEFNNGIKCYTVEHFKEIEEGLKNDTIIATVTQHPYTQGVKAIEYLYNYLIAKKPIPKEKIMDNTLILKNTIVVHKLEEEID